MKCPKCGGDMRSYERNNITIDQCNDCRGVFLDRGELDRLIDAEAGAVPSPAPIPSNQYRERDYYDDDDDRHRHGHKRKKRGFLSEFFDD